MSVASVSQDTSGDDSGYAFVASLSNTRNITQLLKAVHFKDAAIIYASANGLKVTVEESKCIQANAFIQADMFNHFDMREDAVTFKINLTILLECLNIFGGSSTPGAMTTLKMCYGGYGSPLTLLLEEGGVVTNCSIKTQEPEDVLNFDFSNANVVNKIIFKSECLREVFMEIDMSSDVLEILMSPDKPYFRLSTFGDSCTFHMECPKDSEMIEMFQCIRTQTNRYKTSLIKPSNKALALANKISVRTDERGFLCFQFLILTEGGHVCFVEYYCSPDEDNDEDLNAAFRDTLYADVIGARAFRNFGVPKEIAEGNMSAVTLCTKLFRNFLISAQHCTAPKASYTRLAEVGRLETPKQQGKYDTGQLFLHKVFGYRGVVLFPWLARVYDRDVAKKERTGEEAANQNQARREVRGRTHTYYQVLIDSRDCPYVRAQTEAVTFLGNQDNSRSLYAIPGLDYVSHKDVLPYTTTEKQPLSHDLFDKFLMFDPDKDPPFSSRETLRAWQEKNHPWLELSDVHKETTESIRITVIPFYMGCREAQNTAVYWWRYCIRLENLGDMSMQLRERHWRIFSLSGTLETVRGRGVVGQEPVLSKNQPAFQYSSHVSLQAPSGHMWGTFRMEREDGFMFDCRIPPFSLESKQDDIPSPPPPAL